MIEIIPNWHPVAVHFAIGLLLTSAALFVIGVAAGQGAAGRAATVAARWNLGLGMVATLVTLATGWQAYNTVAHDGPSHANMTSHMQWAFGTTAVFLASTAAAWLDRRRDAGAGLLLLTLVLAASAGLVVTGWLGGENVYRYGLGVKSLPKTDGHVHPGAGGHDHGAGEDAHTHPQGQSTAPAGDDVLARQLPSQAPAGQPSKPPTEPHSHIDGHSHRH